METGIIEAKEQRLDRAYNDACLSSNLMLFISVLCCCLSECTWGGVMKGTKQKMAKETPGKQRKVIYLVLLK